MQGHARSNEVICSVARVMVLNEMGLTYSFCSICVLHRLVMLKRDSEFYTWFVFYFSPHFLNVVK